MENSIYLFFGICRKIISFVAKIKFMFKHKPFMFPCLLNHERPRIITETALLFACFIICVLCEENRCRCSTTISKGSNVKNNFAILPTRVLYECYFLIRLLSGRNVLLWVNCLDLPEFAALGYLKIFWGYCLISDTIAKLLSLFNTHLSEIYKLCYMKIKVLEYFLTHITYNIYNSVTA